MALVLHLDLADLLKSPEVRAMVDAAASAVAADVSATSHDGDVEVRVGSYTTDRAAAGVTLAHPAGLAIEAKYGVLAKAAAGAGLDTTRRAG
jgi:hypothetical protein